MEAKFSFGSAIASKSQSALLSTIRQWTSMIADLAWVVEEHTAGMHDSIQYRLLLERACP